MMLLANAAILAQLNLLLQVGLLFLCYCAWHRWGHPRTLAEIACCAGLQRSAARYVWYSAAFAFASVSLLFRWSPRAAVFTCAGAPQQVFGGLGISGLSAISALLYDVLKTGFAEEFLFRGLLAGSLARRLPPAWAKLDVADGSPVTAEIERLNECWNCAWVEKDVVLVETWMAEDRICLAPNGQTLDRQAILDIIRSPSCRLGRGTHTEVKIKLVAEGIVMLAHRWQGAGVFEGKPFEDAHRCAMLCVKQAGK